MATEATEEAPEKPGNHGAFCPVSHLFAEDHKLTGLEIMNGQS